jgi:hypothetical protein
MADIAKAPEFELEQLDRSRPVKELHELAARRLVEVLELAEALPFTPRDHLDLPRHGQRRVGSGTG